MRSVRIGDGGVKRRLRGGSGKGVEGENEQGGGDGDEREDEEIVTPGTRNSHREVKRRRLHRNQGAL